MIPTYMQLQHDINVTLLLTILKLDKFVFVLETKVVELYEGTLYHA